MNNQKLNILCVDDEPLILNALKALFRFRYNVLTTLEATDAIEILKTQNIAVVISDQRMPNMTGAEFLKIAKEVSPNTTRILLTGYSDLDAIISTVNDSEVYRFLTKPWVNEEVIGIVKEAIEVHQAMQGEVISDASPPSFTFELGNILDDLLPSTDEKIERPPEPEPEPEPEPKKSSKQDSYVIFNSRLTSNYEAIKNDFDPNVKLLHAKNSEDVLKLLSTYPVKIIIANLHDSGDSVDILKYLKRELPELLSIGLVKYADHQEIITLINEVKLYRYLVMPLKPGQLSHFVNSAITMHDKFSAKPNLLKQQKVIEKEPIKSSIATVFGSIASIFKRSKK